MKNYDGPLSVDATSKRYILECILLEQFLLICDNICSGHTSGN